MAKKRSRRENGGERAEVVAATGDFATRYPNIAAWVEDGWIEMGRDACNRSFVRALDIGGLVWEGKAGYGSLHEALRALDAGIGRWVGHNR